MVGAAAFVSWAAVSPHALTAQDGLADDGAMCEGGAVSAIDLDRKSVFDPESTGFGPLAWAYRALNLLHVRTAPSFIRRELLIAEGDCFDPFLVSESERLLDQYGFLSQARITDEDDGSGGKRLLVSTQDEWSTKVDVGVTYDAGPNLEKLQVTEENFLGQGVFAEYTHRERRETKTDAFGLATPRLFGRTDASVAWGQARPGYFFDQYLRYPFIGETGDYSVRQGFNRGTDFFSYSTDGAESFSQVLVPVYRELIEFSAARRFGEPGRSVIAGLTFTRDVVHFPRSPEVALVDDFDDLQPFPGLLPPALASQLQPSAATRIAVQLGTRRYTYREVEGLDAVRDRMLVSVGVFAGITVGRGFGVLTPEGVPSVNDYFGRGHVSFGVPVGSSFLHGGATVESRRDAGDWRDLLVDSDLVAYLRSEALASHTFFARASFAGGWNTELPFQLSLGGREGVRSLAEDRFPGGRMARFVIEDRIVFPWPPPGVADLGLTAFADLGRIWRGDVPYAVDSGWEAALGVGLRIGLPANTRNAWRADVAFPVGPTGGDPIFRVTFESNRLRAGFFTPDVFRSRRFNLGPDHF